MEYRNNRKKNLAVFIKKLAQESSVSARLLLTKALGVELPADGADSCDPGLSLLQLHVQHLL